MKGDIIFNGVDLGEFLNVKTIGRSFGPPVTVTRHRFSGMSGSVFASTTREERIIDVAFDMKAASPEQLSEFIVKRAHLLQTDAPARLELVDVAHLNVYEMAVIEGTVDLDRAYHIGQGNLTFVVPDGLYRASTVLTPRLGMITYVGQVPTRPKIEITGATGNVTVRNLMTGQRVVITKPVAATDTITIDNEAGQVLINGTNANEYVALASEWIELVPGTNQIETTSGSGILEVINLW